MIVLLRSTRRKPACEKNDVLKIEVKSLDRIPLSSIHVKEAAAAHPKNPQVTKFSVFRSCLFLTVISRNVSVVWSSFEALNSIPLRGSFTPRPNERVGVFILAPPALIGCFIVAHVCLNAAPSSGT